MPTDTTLTSAEIALARHHTYILLSRLYLEALTSELLPYVHAIPTLAVTLPNHFDADQAAADHYDLFSFNLFPYQSVFLDPTGLLGGDITENVAYDYLQAGFRAFEMERADQIGYELAFLGFLSGAEADAWEDNLIPIALRMQQLATDFLQKQLLRWLPPFIIALQRQAYPFYAHLAELTLELVYNHLSGIQAPPSGKTQKSEMMEQGSGEKGEGEGEAEGDEEEGDDEITLQRIVSHLISPSMSGIYLSRYTIGELAREQHLPRGFGSRKQILSNLLRVGEQYDQTATLLKALQDLLKGWQEAYITMQMTYPQLKPFIEAWLARSTESLEIVMAQRASTGVGTGFQG